MSNDRSSPGYLQSSKRWNVSRTYQSKHLPDCLLFRVCKYRTASVKPIRCTAIDFSLANRSMKSAPLCDPDRSSYHISDLSAKPFKSTTSRLHYKGLSSSRPLSTVQHKLLHQKQMSFVAKTRHSQSQNSTACSSQAKLRPRRLSSAWNAVCVSANATIFLQHCCVHQNILEVDDEAPMKRKEKDTGFRSRR